MEISEREIATQYQVTCFKFVGSINCLFFGTSAGILQIFRFPFSNTMYSINCSKSSINQIIINNYQQTILVQDQENNVFVWEIIKFKQRELQFNDEILYNKQKFNSKKEKINKLMGNMNKLEQENMSFYKNMMDEKDQMISHLENKIQNNEGYF